VGKSEKMVAEQGKDLRGERYIKRRDGRSWLGPSMRTVSV